MVNPDSTNITPLILASGSPRRRELLAQLGIPFRVVVSDITESIAPDLSPEAQAKALAEQKARAVARGIETGLVLGADTIVVLDGNLLGKPADDAEAIDMLQLLSGRDHRVVTGIAVIDAASGPLRSSAGSSVVRFRKLSADDIAAYVATGESRDKAGAYAIQGLGADLVSDLEGCFSNVVGLPLCETASLLRDAGLNVSATWPGCRQPGGERCPRQV